MRTLLIQRHCICFPLAGAGVVTEDEEEQESLRQALLARDCVPVFLSSETVELYYNGYCNNVLWPLFHYVPIPFESRLADTNNVQKQWEAYQQANKAFADAILSVYEKGDCVWLHDYHLLQLARYLKNVEPDMKVGWFLHTPFPSSEIYRTLPLREEILRSLLSNDLVGFHTYDYARHFVSACTRLLGCEGTPEGVEDASRLTRVAAFPIGIDPDRFTKALHSERVKRHTEELRRRFGDRQVMLGVDRLDMIKGIPQKLLGFERFLEEHPEWRDHVLLVQIAVPTRQDVPEYQRLAAQVHEIVGRINGRFGSLSSLPIHHLDRSMGFEELCALYAVTDVLLVTSLRDGMNLVCYEFVACQQQDNAGVLVLSEFAGAAQSLGAGAILVNPWSVTDMAGAIEDALTMPSEDRKERHRQNFVHVTTHTAQAWADTFISELNDTHVERALRTKKMPMPLKTEELLQSFASANKRLLVLGFNASLAFSSFESSSNLFAKASSTSSGNSGKRLKVPLIVDERARKALDALCKDNRTEVAVISGQERATLDTAFAGMNHKIHMAAENGVFIKPAGKTSWRPTSDVTHLGWLESVQLVFDYFAERTPRSFVETREASIVWNYRRSDPDFGRLQERDLLQHLITGPISTSHVDVVQGSNSVEVRPAGVSKGTALEQLLREQDQNELEYDFILCGGHFLSRDEDLFSCVQGKSSSFSSDRGWTPQPNASASNQARGLSSAAMHDGSIESNLSAAAEHDPAQYTVTIGRKQSRAKYYLPDCERMAELLQSLSCNLDEQPECASHGSACASPSEQAHAHMFDGLSRSPPSR